MANNVDLMVVGVAGDISAAELTERLVAEFKQPAEAFSELVAAACGDGPRYAAQTGVSLDTAAEGQGKLEELGIVCQLVIDGDVIPSSTGLSGPRTDTTSESSVADESDTELSSVIEPQLDSGGTQPAELNVEANDIPASTDELEVIQDDAAVITADDLTIEVAEADAEITQSASEAVDSGRDNLSVSDDDFEVSFDDELESISLQVPDTAAPVEASLETDSLDGIELDFSDELDTLSSIADSVPQSASSVDAADDSSAEQSSVAEDNEGVKESGTELSASIDLAAEQKPAEDISASQAVSSGDDASAVDFGELELTLATDSELSLTKTTKKSDAALDDGGLTLLSDEEVHSLNSKSSTASGVSIGAPPALDSDDGVSVNFSLDDLSPETHLEVDHLDENGDENGAADIQMRDTSREPVEVEQPVAAPDEEHPESTSDNDQSNDQSVEQESESPAETGRQKEDVSAIEIGDAVGSSPEAEAEGPAGNPALSALETVVESVPIKPDDSVQAASEDIANAADSLSPVAGANAESNEPANSVESVSLNDSAPDVEDSTVIVADGKAIAETEEPSDTASYAPEITDANEASDKQSKQRRKKQLTLAAAVVGVAGVGALVALQTGLLGQYTDQSASTIAIVVPDKANENDTAELDAVAQVSLNAALERSAVQTNPDNFSTEELIAYLSDDLGENARKELSTFISGESPANDEESSPALGAAIPADSDSDLWLRNRVQHDADRYFDQWSKRKIDLQAYLELQERLIQAGDLDIALEVSVATKDKLFSVISQQRLARALYQLGDSDKARDVLNQAERRTYSMESEAERVMAIADYAATEYALGLNEDAADSFLKAQILARSMHKPATRTVAYSALAEYLHRAGRRDDAVDFLDQAMTTANELPVNTAARDLAIRHVALTEVVLGMTDQALEHANLIVDPFAAVSALHGIALELERSGDIDRAHLTLNMAYRAGSLITDSSKRDKLLDKIKLAGNG